MSQAAAIVGLSSGPRQKRQKSRKAHRPGVDRGEQRHKRLLTRAKKDPRSVLEDRRCLKPAFCEQFLDHCHDMALQDAGRALELAPIAAELAAKIGDRHLVHVAEGVRVHTHIANEQRRQAAEVLEDYRLSALTCCSSCAADWYLRQGDLLVEDHDIAAAGVALEKSLESLGQRSGDRFGRACLVRGIDHHFKRHRDQALDDMATALLEIDLSSPRGYFLDGVALLPCFLQGGYQRRHDERVREILDRFRQRLLGIEDCTAVRTRCSWVDGQVSARLGEWRRAHDGLGQARRHLFKTAPPKHVLAAGLDHCQLWAWRPNDATRKEILHILRYYEKMLDLEPLLVKRLHHVIRIVSHRSRHTPAALSALRASFIVPVPGIVKKAPRLKKHPRPVHRVAERKVKPQRTGAPKPPIHRPIGRSSENA